MHELWYLERPKSLLIIRRQYAASLTKFCDKISRHVVRTSKEESRDLLLKFLDHDVKQNNKAMERLEWLIKKPTLSATPAATLSSSARGQVPNSTLASVMSLKVPISTTPEELQRPDPEEPLQGLSTLTKDLLKGLYYPDHLERLQEQLKTQLAMFGESVKVNQQLHQISAARLSTTLVKTANGLDAASRAKLLSLHSSYGGAYQTAVDTYGLRQQTLNTTLTEIQVLRQERTPAPVQRRHRGWRPATQGWGPLGT